MFTYTRLVTRGLFTYTRNACVAAAAPLFGRPRAAVAAARIPLPPLLPHSLVTRSIITVDVHQPSDRASIGDPAARSKMMSEVARAEEIALAQFNRLVNEELARACLRPGARRNKRWARLTRRGLRMRDNHKATKWRAYKRRSAKLMTWVRAENRVSLVCICTCLRSPYDLLPTPRFNTASGGARSSSDMAKAERHGALRVPPPL